VRTAFREKTPLRQLAQCAARPSWPRVVVAIKSRARLLPFHNGRALLTVARLTLLCALPLAACTQDDCSSPGGPSRVAFNPNPSHGDDGIGASADLTWSAGYCADSHDVYFGTKPAPAAAELQGNQTEAVFDPGVLDANTTYYWRVDEVHGSDVVSGNVWSFTTADTTVGCQFGAVVDEVSEQGMIAFESVVQKKLAAVKIYTRMIDAFPAGPVATVRDHGTAESPTTPYIDIHPSAVADDTTPRLQEIIDGDYDAYFQSWAQETKAFGEPVWICFDGEMNGDWHNGSGAANGGGTFDGYGDPTKPDGPERFVDAWRHVHDIFAAAGADNVAWVWSVNQEDWPSEYWNRFENYYPGDAYVDWLGVDGYNWGGSDWRSFTQVFDEALGRLRGITTERPVIIAEFASAHRDGAKSEWITDAFNRLKTNYPFVDAVIWFDLYKERDWRIGSDGPWAARDALSDAYFESAGDPGKS
jgi:beta-mannanase